MTEDDENRPFSKFWNKGLKKYNENLLKGAKMKLFIDGSNITYLCMFTAEKYPNALEAFPRIYANVVNKMQRDYAFYEMIFAWEGSGNSIKHRLELFPDYKKNRQGGADKPTREFRKLAKAFNEEKGWRNISLPDTEADDVIYALANIYKESKKNNIIISSDHDFIQIAQEGLVKGIFSKQQKRYLEIPEYDIVTYKCLAGDSSDSIPGVKGCGPKTALKYMKEGVPPEHFSTVGMFWKIVSMKDYSITHDTINRVKELLNV